MLELNVNSKILLLASFPGNALERSIADAVNGHHAEPPQAMFSCPGLMS